MKNKNLNLAKKNKNDEFYTYMDDIEKELKHYESQLENKVIYCNCDSTESNFYKYFKENFTRLKIKKLITSHYADFLGEENTKSIYCTIENNIETRTELEDDGDFRSSECIRLLKEADIVVTNPPFSLFREYITLMMKHDKDFLVIGNINALHYMSIFPYIKKQKIKNGHNRIRKFYNSNQESLIAACWYSTLWVKPKPFIELTKTYNSEDYIKYENYNAINVDKVKHIPLDYMGCMGVPSTFLLKYNPNQFEIIGKMASPKVDEFNFGLPYINGKSKYARIVIRNHT